MSRLAVLSFPLLAETNSVISLNFTYFLILAHCGLGVKRTNQEMVNRGRSSISSDLYISTR